MNNISANTVEVEHRVYAHDPKTGQDLTVPLKTRDGSIVCANCEAPAKLGWVYRFGAITLITCNKRACFPSDPAWVQGVRFYH